MEVFIELSLIIVIATLMAAVLAGRTAARAAVEELMLRKQRPEADDV